MRFTMKKIAVFAAVVMGFVLGVHALSLYSESFYKPLGIPVSEDKIFSIEEKASFTKFSVSGRWTGHGSAKIFLIDGDKAWLVADTSRVAPNLNSVHLSDFCDETCYLSGLKPSSLAVQISGTGVFMLDGYSFNTDTDIAGAVVGLASCPDCKKIRVMNTPDHGVFFIVLLLLITILGSHQLSHHSNLKKRKIAIGALVGSFVVLSALFIFAFLQPHSQLSIIIRYAASILSAAGVLTLFVLGGVELSEEKEVKVDSNIWKELEKEEAVWERKK